MYELRVLGSPRLVGPDGNDVRSVLSQPKRLALLSYLAVTTTGSYVRRDKLLGLLWAESTEERARASLSEALSKLRRSLDPAVITTRGEQEVGVDASQLRCDAVEFLRAVDSEDWSRAVEAYGGPLLDGFFLDGCPEFDTWLEHTRAHLKRTAVDALGRLTEEAMTGGDESARALAERAYEIDPLDGGAVRRLMQVLALAGQRDAAVGVYERYAATVREERGIEPSQETVVLVQRIREGRLFRRPGPDEEVDAAVVSPAGVDPEPSLPPSEVLSRLNAALEGRYRIEREVGRGGMATVYLADDLRHDRRVALKVLKPELASGVGPERFPREVAVTASLEHPHVVPLLDSGETDGFLYYVMPFVAGESLRQRLDREGQLPVDDALRITQEVADALGYAHGLGVIHRDIKPGNVLLSAGHARVTDFGIARAVTAAGDEALTQTGIAIGTPKYMSPEQASGEREVDARADIYSLACVTYEMLAGEPPFTGSTPDAILAKKSVEEPPSLRVVRETVPVAVEAVIAKALAKTPADRYPTAREFAQALSDSTTTPGIGLASPGRPRARRLATTALLGVILAASAAGVWYGMQDGPAAGDTAGAGTVSAGTERLFVLPLRNLTSDPELDVWGQLAADQIGRLVDRVRPVAVVPSTAVNDAVEGLGTGASVEAVAAAVGATYAFAGTVSRTGEQMRFEVEFLDIRTGERLRTLDPIAGPEAAADSLVAALAQGAAVAAVGYLTPDAAAMGPDANVPPRLQSMPVSLPAYVDYNEQLELFCRGDYRRSIAAGERALEKSRGFVGSLLTMMFAYGNLGFGARADSLRGVLDGLRDRMMTHERALLDWSIARANDDPVLEERSAEEMYRINPSGNHAGGAMFTATQQRRMEDAIERLAHLDLDGPCEFLSYWVQGSVAYHALDRYDEELALARHGLGHYPNHRTLMSIEIRAMAGLDRVEAVDSLLNAMDALPPPDDPYDGLVFAARELRAHGLEEAAERLFRRALDGYASGPPDRLRSGRADAFYYTGRWTEADTLLVSLLLEDPSDLGLLSRRGVVLARLDRRDEALEISRRLAEVTGRPLDGRHILGQVMIAAALGDRDAAARLLNLGWESGLRYDAALHTEPAFDEMWGYAPWDALMAPRE